MVCRVEMFNVFVAEIGLLGSAFLSTRTHVGLSKGDLLRVG